MNLQKLRNASLHELRVRASQRVAAFSERRGWSSLVKLPHDLPNTDSVLQPSRFFSGFQDLEKSAAEMKSRWPDTAQRIVEQADHICAGKFDLLGFTELSFGDPIDWHFEPISGKRIPLLHWSKLDYLVCRLLLEKKKSSAFLSSSEALSTRGQPR